MNEYFNISLPYIQIEQVSTCKYGKLEYNRRPQQFNIQEIFRSVLINSCIVKFKIEMRDSKFGSVLVVESTEHSGGYILGFRIDPAARMKQVLQEVRSLHFTQIRNPQLGIVWNSSVQGIKVLTTNIFHKKDIKTRITMIIPPG